MSKEVKNVENVEFVEVAEEETTVKTKKIDAEKAKSIGKKAGKVMLGVLAVGAAFLLGSKVAKGRKTGDVCEDDDTDYDNGYSYDMEDDAE